MASPGRASRPVIVSPEAAADMRRASDAAVSLGPSVAEDWERELDLTLEALAAAALGDGSAIARRRIGTSTWAVLYVTEPRRVVVVALVRSRPKQT